MMLQRASEQSHPAATTEREIVYQVDPTASSTQQSATWEPQEESLDEPERYQTPDTVTQEPGPAPPAPRRSDFVAPPVVQQQQQQHHHQPRSVQQLPAPIPAPVAQLDGYTSQGSLYVPQHYPDLATLHLQQQVMHYPPSHQKRQQRRQRRHQQQQQQRRRVKTASAPALSVLSSTVETDSSETESEIASSASAYRSARAAHSMDACDAMERARSKGGVMGLCEALSPYDFVCPHCVEMEPVPTGGPIVSFSCCSRRAHYRCMARIPNVHELASQDVPPCIQCLRPSELVCHETVLSRYREAMQKRGDIPVTASGSKHPGDRPAGSRDSRLRALWDTYDALHAHLKQQGLVEGLKDFVRSEDRTKPPEIDRTVALERGLDARALLAAGWSLETMSEEFRLFNVEDKDWQRLLGFDRNVLLELSLVDMLHLMSEFKVHPYQLREHFGIRLRHLWSSADRRRNGGSRGSNSRSQSPAASLSASGLGRVTPEAVQSRLDSERRANEGKRSRGPSRGFETTEAICAHHRVLSPSQMAVLGFDIHHLIIMGFSKDHFANFRWFSMDDWITHLGFRKTHWNLLRLTTDDFRPPVEKGRPGGVFSGLQGWNLDTLTRRWMTTPTELCEMGMVTSQQLQALLNPAPVAETPGLLAAPRPPGQGGRSGPMMMYVQTPYGPQPATYYGPAAPPPYDPRLLGPRYATAAAPPPPRNGQRHRYRGTAHAPSLRSRRSVAAKPHKYPAAWRMRGRSRRPAMPRRGPSLLRQTRVRDAYGL